MNFGGLNMAVMRSSEVMSDKFSVGRRNQIV
jgi:hypothetical protein